MFNKQIVEKIKHRTYKYAILTYFNNNHRTENSLPSTRKGLSIEVIDKPNEKMRITNRSAFLQ